MYEGYRKDGEKSVWRKRAEGKGRGIFHLGEDAVWYYLVELVRHPCEIDVDSYQER